MRVTSNYCYRSRDLHQIVGNFEYVLPFKNGETTSELQTYIDVISIAFLARSCKAPRNIRLRVCFMAWKSFRSWENGRRWLNGMSNVSRARNWNAAATSRRWLYVYQRSTAQRGRNSILLSDSYWNWANFSNWSWTRFACAARSCQWVGRQGYWGYITRH
jgi:hypothetical protein